MIKTENFEKVEVTSTDILRAWLTKHHGQEDSVWLVTFKKQHQTKYVSVEEILDELLCFGWIDGICRKLDDDRTMQLISPRKTQYWAKSYKDRVAKLTEAGLMHEAGLASVEAGKKSGLWSFMDDVDALIVPEDLRAAFDSHKDVADRFEAYPPAYRRNVLRWIKLAKTETTRAKRVAEVAKTTAKGDRIPQM